MYVLSWSNPIQYGEFMTKNRQKIAFVILFAVMTVGMSAFVGNGLFIQAQEVEQGDSRIVYAHPYELSNEYSQWTAQSYVTNIWLQATGASLFKRSAADSYGFVGDLASGTLDDLGDDNDTTFRVKLRTDIKHPSGNTITADDVVFSFRVSTDPTISVAGGAVTQQRYFGDTNSSNDDIGDDSIPNFDDHVKKVDDTTIDFVLRESYAFSEALISGPSVIEKALYEEAYNEGTTDMNNDNGEDANGAGPYKVRSIDLDDSIVVLERNENTHRPNNNISRITFRFYSTPEAALADFADGKVQILDSQFAQKEKTYTDAGAVASIVSDPATQQLEYNHIHPYYGTGLETPLGKANKTAAPEAAKYLRQGFSHIIARESIVETVLEGLGSEGVTQFTPASTGFDDKLEHREFSIEKAREKFVAAGFDYDDLGDEDPDTKAFSKFFFNVHVYSPNSNPNRNQWAVLITDNFEKIGVNFTHESVGWDILAPRTFAWAPTDDPTGTVPVPLYDDGGFDMFFVGLSWALDWDPASRYDADKYSPESSNFANVRNDNLTTLVDNYVQQPDSTKRDTAAKALQLFLQDFEPESTIVYPSSVWGFHMNVSGYDTLLFSVTSQEWDMLEYYGESGGFLPFYLDATVVVFGLLGLLGLAALLVKRRSL